MSLPELPEPNVLRPAFVYDAYGTIIDHAQPLGSYTPKQMHEYGQSCRKQALEEAAALCLSMQTVSGDDDVERGFNAALRRASTVTKELI